MLHQCGIHLEAVVAEDGVDLKGSKRSDALFKGGAFTGNAMATMANGETQRPLSTIQHTFTGCWIAAVQLNPNRCSNLWVLLGQAVVGTTTHQTQQQTSQRQRTDQVHRSTTTAGSMPRPHGDVTQVIQIRPVRWASEALNRNGWSAA